jgi:hypothetical protein
LARPFGETLDIKGFIEVVVTGKEGATQDCIVKTLTTRKHLHNMSLDLSLEDLQGSTEEALDLSIDFLIQLSFSTFHLSWPNLVSAKASSNIWFSQYQELNGSLTKVLSR